MAAITIKVDVQLVDEAVRILGAKSRSDAVHVALREVVSLPRFKKLMKNHAGKIELTGRGQ